jgi:hypothetical protein
VCAAKGASSVTFTFGQVPDFAWVGDVEFFGHSIGYFADYPIEPRSCLPELASSLASAQSAAVDVAMMMALPFGLTTPASAAATDLFIPTGEHLHGVAVYRGLNRGEWIYRCDPAKGNLLSISISSNFGHDCNTGRLMIDLETAQIRTTLADEPQGGVHFSLEMDTCRDVLFSEEERLSIIQVSVGSADREIISFVEGSSTRQVACTLLWKFGVHAAVRKHDTTVVLPAGVGSIELVGDIVVRKDEVLKIEAGSTTSGMARARVQLILGPRQIQVDRGGKLELVWLEVASSFGGSALVNGGEVYVHNCSFSRNEVSLSAVQRVTDLRKLASSNAGVVPEAVERVVEVDLSGCASDLSALGGAVFVTGILKGYSSQFDSNLAAGAAINAGGAICNMRGFVELSSGTLLRNNTVSSAGGCMASGGALYSQESHFVVSDSQFVANSLIPGLGGSAFRFNTGGAMALAFSQGIVNTTVFESNVANGDHSLLFALGGAIYLNGYSKLNVDGSIFQQNMARDGQEATYGGAIAVEVSELIVRGPCLLVNV